MNRRASHRWLIWLLPFFVLRSFVPAGFMLAWVDGGLQVTLCPGSAAMTLQLPAGGEESVHAAHAAHQDHAQHAGHAQGEEDSTSPGPQTDKGSLCPFAAAGSTGISPPTVAVAFAPLVHERIEFPARPGLPSSPVLIDRIRGPPLA